VQVLLRAHGPETGELRYLVTRPGNVTPQPIARSPQARSPRTWREGFVYIDTVPLSGPGKVAVELVSSDPTPRVLAHVELVP
jgi:hypothetical protein